MLPRDWGGAREFEDHRDMHELPDHPMETGPDITAYGKGDSNIEGEAMVVIYESMKVYARWYFCL